MSVIASVLGMVDATVTGAAVDSYDIVVDAVMPVVRGCSIMLLAMVGLNVVLQYVPLTNRTALSLGLRIVLVNIFLTSANITVPYDALTNAPSEFGGALLSALSGEEVTNLYAGLDELYLQSLGVGDAIAENGGMVSGPMASVVLFLVAALMATVTIIVLSAAKIMLAVLFGLAPLVICCTFFKQSAPIFEAWVKLAIGFALIPLFVAAMAGFTIATANALTPEDIGDIETLSAALSFLVVMMLGTGLMLLVPSFAQSMAATNIAIGSIAGRTIQYPGDTLRAAMDGGRGFREGLRGQSATNYRSLPAQGANLAARGVRQIHVGPEKTVAIAKKMIRSGEGKKPK